MDEENHEKNEDFLYSVVYEREQLNFEDIRENFKKLYETKAKNWSLKIPAPDYRKLILGERISVSIPLGTSFANNDLIRCSLDGNIETGYVTEEYIRERLLFCPKELLEKYYDLEDKLINELKYFELFLRSKNIESTCEIIYRHIIFEDKEKPVTEEELTELLKIFSVNFQIKVEDLEELKEFFENLDVEAFISSIGGINESPNERFLQLKVKVFISN
jgi:hypothetical protein